MGSGDHSHGSSSFSMQVDTALRDSSPKPPKPPFDVGRAGIFAAAAIGLVVVVVSVLGNSDKQETAPASVGVVWDAPSQGFFSALAAAGVKLADDRSKQNILVTGNALCARFAEPEANKEDIAKVVEQGMRPPDGPQGPITKAQALAVVEAANANLCPAAVVPASAPAPVPVVVPVAPNVPNVPNVPNPPYVSGGGGGGNGGESRFCRKRWWC